MNEKSNFRRGSVELLVLYLLNQKDYYGYELSLVIREESKGVLDIPVGSLYPALYKLIDLGYITDYKKQIGKRLTRVYYHIEKEGCERLEVLLNDYRLTTEAIQNVLKYQITEGESDFSNASKE